MRIGHCGNFNAMNIEPRTIKVENEDYNIRNYVNYAKGVLDGTITAGQYIKLACKRFIERFNRDDMYFDVADVDKRIIFISKLKHTTGQHFGHRFKLLDWQQFCIANIFGWKWKETNKRVTQNVLIFVSRKNGKTALCAAIALASIICDGEHDMEIDLVANNAKQAGISLKHIQMFIKSIDPNEKLFKRFRNEVRIPALESNIQVLASDAMGLDGYSASVCILDEFHANKNWDIYNVMRSSMGARLNPLMICITTAGFLIGDAYPCYSMWQADIDILKGLKEDDSVFAAIFQKDDEDQWDDNRIWEKFCPSLNQTVSPDYIRTEINSAKNNTSLETGVRTKTINEWCQSEDIWLPHDLIKRNMQSFEIEDLIEMGVTELGVGVDLSAISDITAVSLCAKVDEKFYFKNYSFLPEDCLQTGVNHQLYFDWKRKKQIHVTDGNVVDYDYIIALLQEIDEKIMLSKVYYDSWNATQFAINMTEKGFDMIPFSQAIGNFSRYTKAFERELRLGNIVIDDNLVTQFCFDNVTLKHDINENVKPCKGISKSAKIDIVIAMIQAFATQLDADNYLNISTC